MKNSTTKSKFKPIHLMPTAQRYYDAFKEQGVLDNYMLTLGTPPGQRHKNTQWFIKNWKNIASPWENRNNRILHYWIVANKGGDGRSKASAHVVFVGPRRPVDFEFLMNTWKTRYGTIMPESVEAAKKNRQGLKYFCKNYNEWDADLDGA